MGYGNDELDVAHAFATHFLFRHLDTASVADNTFVTDALILSAMTFIVLDGTENAFAEQTVTFGFVGAVVDCLGLQHLSA